MSKTKDILIRVPVAYVDLVKHVLLDAASSLLSPPTYHANERVHREWQDNARALTEIALECRQKES